MNKEKILPKVMVKIASLEKKRLADTVFKIIYFLIFLVLVASLLVSILLEDLVGTDVSSLFSLFGEEWEVIKENITSLFESLYFELPLKLITILLLVISLTIILVVYIVLNWKEIKDRFIYLKRLIKKYDKE